jgi:hypothetical protein
MAPSGTIKASLSPITRVTWRAPARRRNLKAAQQAVHVQRRRLRAWDAACPNHPHDPDLGRWPGASPKRESDFISVFAEA